MVFTLQIVLLFLLCFQTVVQLFLLAWSSRNVWNPVSSFFLAIHFFRLSSLLDDYPVLLTSSSEYRKHLPNLVNASWLWRISVPLEPIIMADPLGFLPNFFRWKGRTVPRRFLLFEEDVKNCKKNCFRSLLLALNQAHLELQTKEFTAKYCCINKDVRVNSFNAWEQENPFKQFPSTSLI